MGVESGQKLSHYRLVEKIGEGGMGVVWKAEDTVLNRTVAIKVLPADLALDEDRRRMFLDEARLAASVSHGNIVQVHELNREGALDFIVMEYVDGHPLSKVLRGKPLPPEKVADWGLQIAEGLTRAHRKGLIHRDLKPANLLVTRDNDVKIVDFGLAALFEQRDSTVSLASVLSEPISEKTKTRIAGTLPYMSPEQVQGEKLDARSDIFSFGSVLYELTTGQRPFVSAEPTSLVQEILTSRPTPIHELVPNVPIELDRIISKALARRPTDRYQHTDDFVVDLKRLSKELESGSSPSYEDLQKTDAAKRRRMKRLSVMVAFTLVALGATWLAWMRERRETDTGHRAEASVNRRQVTFTGTAAWPAISPDGQFLAYIVGKPDPDSLAMRVMIQELDGGDALEVFRAHSAWGLRWSPDGTTLSLLARQEQDAPGWALYLVARLGGTPRRLQFAVNMACWSPDGTRIAGYKLFSSRIWVVNTVTNDTTSIPINGTLQLNQPELDWSPTGNRLVFSADGIWAIKTDGSQQHELVERGYSPRWSADGRTVYYLVDKERGMDLWKIRVNERSGEPSGRPMLLATDLPGGTDDPSRGLWPSMSLPIAGRRLACTGWTEYSNLWISTAVHGEAGQLAMHSQITTGTYEHTSPQFSPSGQHLAFSRGTKKEANIFVHSLQDGTIKQLTFMESYNTNPVWSTDGSTIVFVSTINDSSSIWAVSSAGGAARPLKTRSGLDIAWSPGPRLIYQDIDHRNFHLLDPITEETTPLVHDNPFGWMFSPRSSPDGTRIAVEWNRTDSDELDGIWIISTTDSSQRLLVRQRPLQAISLLDWSQDSSSIYVLEQWPRPAKILRVFVDRAAVDTLSTLQFPEAVQSVALSPDKSTVVYSLAEVRKDVWLVENLDLEF